MKFFVAQLDLLKYYLTDEQIEEIKAFDPKEHEAVKERCIVTRKNGSQCSNFKKNGDFCNLHKQKEDIPTEHQCSSVKKNGEKCSLKIKDSGVCYRHLKKQQVLEDPRSEDEPISQEFVTEED